MTGSLKTVVQLLFNTSVTWQTLKLCLVIQRTFWEAKKVRMSEQRENKHNYGDGILFSKQTFHTTCMTNRTKYLEFFLLWSAKAKQEKKYNDLH